MLQLVQSSVAQPNPALPEIALRADRITLAKRLWRGTAEDGTEFGFELEKPLRHGDTVWQTTAARYVIHQYEEPVVEIALDLPPSAAAGIGWAIGNLGLQQRARLLSRGKGFRPGVHRFNSHEELREWTLKNRQL